MHGIAQCAGIRHNSRNLLIQFVYFSPRWRRPSSALRDLPKGCKSVRIRRWERDLEDLHEKLRVCRFSTAETDFCDGEKFYRRRMQELLTPSTLESESNSTWLWSPFQARKLLFVFCKYFSVWIQKQQTKKSLESTCNQRTVANRFGEEETIDFSWFVFSRCAKTRSVELLIP